MSLGRQRDHKSRAVEARIGAWTGLFSILFKKHREDRSSCFASDYLRGRVFFAVAAQVDVHYKERRKILQSCREIRPTSFVEHRFPTFSDAVMLQLFRCCRADIYRLVPFIAWPEAKHRTKRNRYAVTLPLVTCVVLRRLASPTRWADLELLFGLQTSQLSEVFWEGMQHFLAERSKLILGEPVGSFWAPRFEECGEAVEKKSNAFENVVAFIDGTNLAVSRPSGENIDQRVLYNGHKRKHCIKFQALTTPCGMAMHVAGPIEGRRHDWTLYLQSGLETTLGQLLEFEGKCFVIYGDSGYSARYFLYVPFSGSNLSDAQKAFNTTMAKSRVTVEWYFREVKRYWTLLDYRRKLRVKEAAVGSLYLAAILLTNVRNCCYPNTISQYFGSQPSTMEESHRDQ